MMGVAALEEWCRRGLEGYRGVKITNMSSSWRDGLAFCALIHRYRPDLIDFDRLDPQDWTGNCSLAFQVAESQLGIPTLLDVEDVIKNESPDQFFIMTYVAQFYHRFTAPDSGYDSTLTTSFKYSSSEEESPRRIDNTGKRKGGGGANLMEWKRRRPLGLVVSGGLELRIDSPPEEKENPFKSDDTRNHENTLKTYDADDEEGESSEVVLRNIPGIMTEARNGTSGHHDLVLKRKRPNSLNRVSSSSMDKENYCKPKEVKNKTEKRASKRVMKPKFQEPVSKRKMIGISDFPKPYENKDAGESDSQKYMTERRRKRSAESAAYSNLYNQTSARLRDSHDPLIERVKQVPLHIAESQKLLKTSIFQLKSPQYPTKCLILNIYKIKYDKRPTTPPAVKYSQNSIPEQLEIKQAENLQNKLGLQDANYRIPPTAPLGQFKVPAMSPTFIASPLSSQTTMQTNGYAHPETNSRAERFKIKPQERMQSIKLETMPENTIIQTEKYETTIQIHETPTQKYKAASQNYETPSQKYESPAKMYDTQSKLYRKPNPPIKTLTQTYKTQVETHETSFNTHETSFNTHETAFNTHKTQTQVVEDQTPTTMQIDKPLSEAHINRSQNRRDESITAHESKMPAGPDIQIKSETPAPKRRSHAQNRKKEFETDETDGTCTDFELKCETPSQQRRSHILSQFEKFNIQTPSTWKTNNVESRSESFNIQPARNMSKSEHFKSHTLTPRSRSKYEHLIKNLKESQDDNLVIYKVLESTPSKPSTTPPAPVTPYKEPKDKYTIEYLWNIGATNFQTRRPTRKCH